MTKSILNAVIAVVTIAFLTLFMLLEGPTWVERIYGLLSEQSRPRWRKVGGDIYRTVGGYVTGNLAISLIAGVISTAVLLVLGVPYAVALGDCRRHPRPDPARRSHARGDHRQCRRLPPLDHRRHRAGEFFVLYQQSENHVLQPLVYGRTVQLSPLIVLIAVLMGAELAGVIGALGAIPVAGSIQVVVIDWLAHRRQKILDPPGQARWSTYRPERVGHSERGAGRRPLPRALRQRPRRRAVRLEHRGSPAERHGCARARPSGARWWSELCPGRARRSGLRDRGSDRRPVRWPPG